MHKDEVQESECVGLSTDATVPSYFGGVPKPSDHGRQT